MQLISDEVYHGLVYEGAPETSCAWETSREALVVNSFSKYFAMTGWRLGWLLVPPGLLRAVDCLTGNFTDLPARAVSNRRGRGLRHRSRWQQRTPGFCDTRRTESCCWDGLRWDRY